MTEFAKRFAKSRLWYNFRTGEHDVHYDTPEDFADYVPQGPGRAMYEIYVDEYGMEPIQACLKVLNAAIGDGAEEEAHGH